MTFDGTLWLEAALCALLAATLAYCAILERRLRAARAGQAELVATIGALDASLSAAGRSLTALQTAAETVGRTLESRITQARSAIDELSLVAASGERIAQRMERCLEERSGSRPSASLPRAQLPSGSVMERLRTAR
ncbi:MAG TPA: DUF6468 domain-containing protein [Rhizomicrobium sp.]|jgi:hypothetical protein|nr:DUF6468 domain-containing protein [Rhizomicrobium sp.]